MIFCRPSKHCHAHKPVDQFLPKRWVRVTATCLQCRGNHLEEYLPDDFFISLPPLTGIFIDPKSNALGRAPGQLPGPSTTPPPRRPIITFRGLSESAVSLRVAQNPDEGRKPNHSDRNHGLLATSLEPGAEEAVQYSRGSIFPQAFFGHTTSSASLSVLEDLDAEEEYLEAPAKQSRHRDRRLPVSVVHLESPRGLDLAGEHTVAGRCPVHCMDSRLRTIMSNPEIEFGVVNVILCGDFYQLPLASL
jgi:hypothetical protein